MTEERRTERLVVLALVGALALNYPLLDLFDGGVLFGIPSLYLYIFVVWAAFISLAALLMEKKSAPGRAGARARLDE
ncbi:MAG: hypothetical protein GWN37_12565 [Gammaproteobacteria bacterium]|nr:hypothetical protein [Gammaproteobacteria bacterium]